MLVELWDMKKVVKKVVKKVWKKVQWLDDLLVGQKVDLLVDK